MTDKLDHADNTRLAEEAAAKERQMGFREVLATYYPAALWSAFLSCGLIMEGYDIGIINAFFGQNEFINHFGHTNAQGKKYIPATWQSLMNNGAQIGQIIGLLINGYAQAKFGSKRTYAAGMILMVGAIFLPVFSKNLPMLFGGELLCGIPWGIFQTLTTAYAADICPVILRAYLASYVNMCWGIGLFLAAGIVRASLQIHGIWGWRMPYVLQWFWPVPLFIGVMFAPESPRWLVQNGRNEEARETIRRLARTGHYTEEALDAQVALLVHQNELEKEEASGRSYADCFKGTNRRRTEICCVVWAIQILCGQAIAGYATQFLRAAGMSQTGAFNINLISYSMFLVGGFVYWITTHHFGRRTIQLTGLGMLACSHAVLAAMGFVHAAHPENNNIARAIGGILVITNFSFTTTLGPGTYAIVAEMPSSRVRPPTVALARVCYVVSAIVIQQLLPRMLTPQGWGWGTRASCLFIGTCVASWIYCYFRLPETKGRTYGELDKLFSQKVPARQFASKSVNEFARVDHDAPSDAKDEEERIEDMKKH
ncbi:General alpha-glucoside permease [Vanrija pseudolonga]|uniref:General alpha-glucoside permease n=1 Tax=Vanrija pseudolonga TaxID=143232 RepID=A0AAF1BJ12_9TREE|nr:General alpha-glucoside permease [Vanrija pseudolonga]